MPTELLQGALDRLHRAVEVLVDERKRLIEGRIYGAPSLYDQLRGEIPAGGGDGLERTRRVAGSRAPLRIEAVDLVAEIDLAVAAWAQEGADTPTRLRALASRRWRPQDAHGIDQITQACQGWAADIEALLNPVHIKEVRAACPRCGSRYGSKIVAGERVRTPALEVSAEHGCTCAVCGARWRPDELVFLVELIESS